MPGRSPFLFLLIILMTVILVACASPATQSPTADPDTVATIVASTQAALVSPSPTATVTQPEPTQPEPTPLPATPTTTVSPTAEPTPTTVIAYIKGGNVFLWTEYAGSIPLTDTQDAIQVRISSDGRLVAFLRQDPADMFTQELWMVNVNTPSNPQVLVSSADLAALKPADPNPYIGGIGIQDFAWRVDTHELVYTTIILHEGPGFSPNHDLFMLDVDTQQKTTLLETGEGGLFYFSPDGNQLALSKPESISLVNADGTNFRRDVLTFPEVVTYSEYQYHPQPIWASDSNSLRVAIPAADPLGDPLAPTGLWLIPTDGTHGELLGEIDSMPFAWPNNAFAPNLEQVIYATSVGDPAQNLRELRIAKPDGSNDVLYDRGEGLEFSLWAPDSRHFIYVIHGGERAGMYAGALDEQPTLLSSDSAHYVKIHWVNETQFACLVSKGDQWELRITDLAGSDLVLIDTLPDSSPEFDARP